MPDKQKEIIDYITEVVRLELHVEVDSGNLCDCEKCEIIDTAIRKLIKHRDKSTHPSELPIVTII